MNKPDQALQVYLYGLRNLDSTDLDRRVRQLHSSCVQAEVYRKEHLALLTNAEKVLLDLCVKLKPADNAKKTDPLLVLPVELAHSVMKKLDTFDLL